MKKRSLVIGALASLGALAFLLTAVLSPPTQEAQAQDSDCPGVGFDCFDSIESVVVYSGYYQISGTLDGGVANRLIGFDAADEAQKVTANRCLSLARRAQQKNNVAFGWRCDAAVSGYICELDSMLMFCSLTNR